MFIIVNVLPFYHSEHPISFKKMHGESASFSSCIKMQSANNNFYLSTSVYTIIIGVITYLSNIYVCIYLFIGIKVHVIECGWPHHLHAVLH